jgi:hypothetical protein
MIIDVVGNRGISIFISQSEVMAKVAKVASARLTTAFVSTGRF